VSRPGKKSFTTTFVLGCLHNLPLAEEILLNLRLFPDTTKDQRFQEGQKHVYLLEITPYISPEDSPEGLLLAPSCNVEANGIRIFQRMGSFSCSKQPELAKTCFGGVWKRT
jgi:hypothetical protein